MINPFVLKRSMLFLFIAISFISNASSQVIIGQDENNLGVIIPQPSAVITSSSGGGNVSSVTSSTNCITVNPTIGAVIITYNTSCSGTGNSSWTEAYANTLYRKLGDTINQNNISNLFNNLVTSSIGNDTYQKIGISFNQSEFNFIQNLTAYTCSVGFVVNGVNTNGTVKCVADANSGGIISNASLNIQYLNLSGTNANQNINVGIYNITSNWFKGLFNWIVGANPSARYLTFNGSTLDFSESNLNSTIDNRVSRNNTNTHNQTYDNLLGDTCPIGQLVNGTLLNGTIKCQTVTATFDNTNLAYKNNTQTFTGTNTFQNINTKKITSDITNLGEVFTDYTVLNGLLTIASLTNENGVFQFTTRNNIDLFFTTDNLNAQVNVLDIGQVRLRAAIGMLIDNGATMSFQTNDTRTMVTTNVSFTGAMATFTNINASLDVCVTSGKCLNRSINIADPSFNNTMLVWNNSTRAWTSVPESPTNNEVPVFCTSASVGRWTFLDKASGTCPI